MLPFFMHLAAGIVLSLIAIVATPLVARWTHSLPDAESGFVSTTVIGLAITTCFAFGIINMVFTFAAFGASVAYIAVPAYLIVLGIAARVAWAVLGPNRRRSTKLPAGSLPAGA